MFMTFDKSCTVELFNSDNGYDASYSTGSTTACNYQIIKEKKEDGSLEIVSGWVMFPPDTTITTKSIIKFADGLQIPIMTLKNVTNLITGEIKGIRVQIGNVKNGKGL